MVKVCKLWLLEILDPKTLQFKKKLQEVKEERTELYRVQGVNAQRLLTLNEALKEREVECNRLREALKNKEQEEQDIRNELDKWKELVEGEGNCIKIHARGTDKITTRVVSPKRINKENKGVSIVRVRLYQLNKIINKI